MCTVSMFLKLQILRNNIHILVCSLLLRMQRLFPPSPTLHVFSHLLRRLLSLVRFVHLHERFMVRSHPLFSLTPFLFIFLNPLRHQSPCTCNAYQLFAAPHVLILQVQLLVQPMGFRHHGICGDVHSVPPAWYSLSIESRARRFFNTRDCCEFILRPTLIRVIAAAVIAIATFHTSQGTICLHLVSRHQPFAQACWLKPSITSSIGMVRQELSG